MGNCLQKLLIKHKCTDNAMGHGQFIDSIFSVYYLSLVQQCNIPIVIICQFPSTHTSFELFLIKRPLIKLTPLMEIEKQIAATVPQSTLYSICLPQICQHSPYRNNQETHHPKLYPNIKEGSDYLKVGHRIQSRRHWISSRGFQMLSRGHWTSDIVTWRDLQGHRKIQLVA